jgi:hypothetical protein
MTAYKDKNHGVDKPAPRPKPAARFNEARFVKRELTADEARACKASEFTAQMFADEVERLIDSGYKLTVKHDDYNHARACWITPVSADDENAGWILTGRGSTAVKALKQALYKWHVVGGGQPWRFLDGEGFNEIDD